MRKIACFGGGFIGSRELEKGGLRDMAGGLLGACPAVLGGLAAQGGV